MPNHGGGCIGIQQGGGGGGGAWWAAAPLKKLQYSGKTKLIFGQLRAPGFRAFTSFFCLQVSIMITYTCRPTQQYIFLQRSSFLGVAQNILCPTPPLPPPPSPSLAERVLRHWWRKKIFRQEASAPPPPPPRKKLFLYAYGGGGGVGHCP